MRKILNKGMALVLALALVFSISFALAPLITAAYDDEGYECSEDGTYEEGNLNESIEGGYELFNPMITYPGDWSNSPQYYTLYFACPHRDCPYDCCFNVFRIVIHNLTGQNPFVDFYRVNGVNIGDQGVPIPNPSGPVDGVINRWELFGGGNNMPPSGDGTQLYFFWPDENDVMKRYDFVIYHWGNTLYFGSRITSVTPCTCEYIDVLIEKIWDDEDDYFEFRPDDILIQLTRDGENYGDPFYLTAYDDWEKVLRLNRLRDVAEDGTPIEYIFSAVELEVPEHYDDPVVTPLRNVDGVYKITITNTLNYEPYVPYVPYEYDYKEITVIKEWDDEDDILGLRPDYILVQLLRNGVNYEGHLLTLNEDGDWRGVFDELRVYERVDGERINIVYTVFEVVIPEGYEDPIITREGNTITIVNVLEVGGGGNGNNGGNNNNGGGGNGESPVTGDAGAISPLLIGAMLPLLSLATLLGGEYFKKRRNK